MQHDKAELEIEPKRPYSLVQTGVRLSDYRELVDRFDGECYRRLVFVARHPVLVEVRQVGPPSRARLQIKLTGRTATADLARTTATELLEKVLGTSTDVRPFYRRFRTDPLLGPVIRSFSGLRIVGRSSIWETLVQMVVSQQVNLHLAHGIFNHLALALGRRATFGDDTYHTFPTPHRISKLTERDLDGFRLSRSKKETILLVAKAFAEGDLSEKKLVAMPDTQLIEALTSIRGIGRWTAEFTLLRGLGRLDVFPGGDLGVIKYFAQGLLGHRERATERSMREFAESWRPYRGLALIYVYAELRRRRLLESKNKLMR